MEYMLLTFWSTYAGKFHGRLLLPLGICMVTYSALQYFQTTNMLMESTEVIPSILVQKPSLLQHQLEFGDEFFKVGEIDVNQVTDEVFLQQNWCVTAGQFDLVNPV